MATHNEIVKEQLLHMLSATAIFIVLGAIAVGLDAAADAVASVQGVSAFTHYAIEITAHVMLVLDLSLFAVYLYTSSVSLFRAITSRSTRRNDVDAHLARAAREIAPAGCAISKHRRLTQTARFA